MKFMFMIYHDENVLDAMPEKEMQPLVDSAIEYAEEIRRSGHYIASDALQRVRTARTIRVRAGKVSTTAGPFAETKEQLGGFFVIEAKDLDDQSRGLKLRPARASADRSWFPEPLRWDAERPVEARGRVLPRDDHRQLGDGVVVEVPLHAREELVVDVAVRLSDRVGVFERHLLRVAEERALRIVVERLDLLRRDAVPAAHGSIDVLSELAAVPRGHAPIEQRPECDGHALRLLLESGSHRLRGAEVCRVARVEKVGIERRAPELALLLERFAQVVRERLDVDQRDARFPLEHGHLLHVRLCGVPRPVKSQLPRAASGPSLDCPGSY